MGTWPRIESTSPERTQESRAGEGSFRLRIDGNAQAAGRARHEVTRLSPHLDAPLLDDVRLLVSELVSNSLRHAEAKAVELSIAVSSEKVHVEVANAGGDFRRPAAGPVRGKADAGWGLFLVEHLSRDWGVHHDGGSQRVWFELSRA